MKTTTTTEPDLNKPSPSQPGWSWYKWEMLVLLWVAFFLHQGCRQIYNSVIPLIKSELGLTNVQAGLVSSIFTLVYGILVPVAGIVGDRFPRKWVIVCSVAIFSGGILLTGFSSGLVMLVVFISVTTGGGEAFFYPSATSLLAQVHEKSRALALGLLQTGLYVGVVVSGLLAGWIGQNYGWRNSFLVFGGAGVFWTLVVIWRLRNTPPPVAAAGQVERLPIGQVIQYLVRRPSVWLLSLAFGAMVFVYVGFLTWTPAFLNERFQLSLRRHTNQPEVLLKVRNRLQSAKLIQQKIEKLLGLQLMKILTTGSPTPSGHAC